MASPTWIAAAIDDPTLNQAPVGTGPFCFDSRSEDSTTTFVRNDDWWNGDVWLDAIEFVPVTDPDTRTDLLFRGELDALQTTNPASVGDLRDDDAIQNIIDETGEESFAMINSAAPPFDDVRARQALTLATPLQNYRDLIGLGIASDADQMFVPDSKYYNPDVIQEGDDPDGALALVAEYCAERGAEENPVTGGTTCSDGKINIELQWSGPVGHPDPYRGDPRRGLEGCRLQRHASTNSRRTSTFCRRRSASTTSTPGVSSVRPTRHCDNVWLLCRTIGGISLNWPKYCDESRDALLLEAQATTDEATRVSLYQQLSQKVHDDYLYIFFSHTIWDNAFNENVRGICDRLTPEGLPTQCASNGRTWFSSVYLV